MYKWPFIEFNLRIIAVPIYTIFTVILLIKMIIAFRRDDKMAKAASMYKISSLLPFIFSILSYLSQITLNIAFPVLYVLNITTYNAFPFCDTIWPILNASLILKGATQLNYFIIQFDHVFNPTAYKLSKWVTRIYLIFMYIYCFIMVLITILADFYQEKILYNIETNSVDTNPPTKKWTYCSLIQASGSRSAVSIFTITLILIWFLMRLVPWFLFVNRLYVMIKSRLESGRNKENLLPLINLIKKQTLLLTIIILNTMILWLLTFVLPSAYILSLTNFVINDICIFLTFRPHKKYYNLLRCDKCENKCCNCVDSVFNQLTIDAKMVTIPDLSPTTRPDTGISANGFLSDNQLDTTTGSFDIKYDLKQDEQGNKKVGDNSADNVDNKKFAE